MYIKLQGFSVFYVKKTLDQYVFAVERFSIYNDIPNESLIIWIYVRFLLENN